MPGFYLDILNKNTKKIHINKMKNPQPSNKIWEALWGSSPRDYRTPTYHCKVLGRLKCCPTPFFFSRVNTIVTSPEIRNHLSLPPGILLTSDWRWCCFLGTLQRDAGDAAEWTEWSCLSPSPREHRATDSDGRAPVPGEFFPTTSLDRKLERKRVAS